MLTSVFILRGLLDLGHRLPDLFIIYLFIIIYYSFCKYGKDPRVNNQEHRAQHKAEKSTKHTQIYRQESN